MVYRTTEETVDSVIRLMKCCDLDILKTIKSNLDGFLDETFVSIPSDHADTSGDLRAAPRYETDLMGILVRVTDVRPGERKEYAVEIKDISRQGVLLKVDPKFISSRYVNLAFASPGSMTRQKYMEVVRTYSQTDAHSDRLEIGCRSVSDKEVKHLRVQESRVQKMRNRVRHRKEICILVAGPHSKEAVHIANQLDVEGFQVQMTYNLASAVTIGSEKEYELILFPRGGELREDPFLLELIKTDLADRVKLVLLDCFQDCSDFFYAGIDECLVDNGAVKPLLHAIEVAILGQLTRQHERETLIEQKSMLISSRPELSF